MIAQSTRDRKPAPRRAGFTLVEVIVALGLFALIALAGFALLRTVLDSQSRTEIRLRRLSEIQRALFVLTSDLDQVSGRIDGETDRVVFQKTGDDGRPRVVAYSQTGDTLVRTVAGPTGERSQPLLGGVRTARWSYWLGDTGWSPVSSRSAPADATDPSVRTSEPVAVRAVALDLLVTGPDQRPATVRRVVATAEIAR